MIAQAYDIEGVLLDISSPKRDELRAYIQKLESIRDAAVAIKDWNSVTKAQVEALVAATKETT